jgi:hypothetical protein
VFDIISVTKPAIRKTQNSLCPCRILPQRNSVFPLPPVFQYAPISTAAGYLLNTDFIFGLTGNANLLRSAEPAMQQARALYAQRQSLGEDTSVRLYEDFRYGAGSWQSHSGWL